MSADDSDILTIDIRIDDPVLSARLNEILSCVPGLQTVGPDQPADLVLALAKPDATDFELTPRERDVLALLAEGHSNKAIGRILDIAPDTVKFHVGRLIDKLDATGRTDAVAHAVRRGIINL